MKYYDLSRKLCEWHEFDLWRERIRKLLLSGEGGRVPPFLLLALPGISALEQRRASELWLKARLADSAAERAEFARQAPPTPAAPDASNGPRRIRLGYLSSDFHEHATALLLIELLEAHERSHFEVFAYSYGADDEGDMRQRVQRSVEHFIDIEALDIAQSAHAIRRDCIDILIDLKGYTQGSRSALLAFRPAPVQVNYLGYPGTLGAGLCDYLITDRYLTPPESAPAYSEHFAYLPNSYQPHGRHATIDSTPSRQALGLPETGFVFCCFNQAWKITPEVFDIWCRLLADTPGSVLWLLKDRRAEDSLRIHAYQRGIVPQRLIFAPHCGQAEHLGRLQAADLVLDTWPYNAHTTASDALWAGVPLITCCGDTFSARVAGSLLHAIGLPELIATSPAAYQSLATELAHHPQKLGALKARLASLRLHSALFDIRAYTRDLEALYTQMQTRQLAGLTPTVLG